MEQIKMKKGDDMQPYRFETKISESRIIYLPSDYETVDNEVEVVIINKNDKTYHKAKAEDFINKWLGAVENEIDITSDVKMEYLAEKYK
jgi:hypothetical protein